MKQNLQSTPGPLAQITQLPVDQRRRAFIQTLAAAAAGLSAFIISCKKENERQGQQLEKVMPGCPDIFSDLRPIPMDALTGILNDTNNKLRTRTVTQFSVPGGGEVAINELGFAAYKVQQEDTVEKIIQKLAATKEFSYLTVHPAITWDEVGNVWKYSKLRSFNILNEHLSVATWIPIALPEELRIIPEENFINYCFHALAQMCRDPHYGDRTKALIQRVGSRELLCLLYAIAKQESGLGGASIGSCELHRFEPHHETFSYSHFHVLNADAGKNALRYLGLSGARCYHPINGAKLCLAFLFEKSGNPEKYFPLLENITSFASFYNGKNWGKANPHYADHISKYYQEAQTLLASANTSLPAAGKDRSLDQFIGSANAAKISDPLGGDNTAARSKRTVRKIPVNNPYLVKKGDSIYVAVKKSIVVAKDSPALEQAEIKRLSLALETKLSEFYGSPHVHPGDRLQITQRPKKFWNLSQPWQATLIRNGRKRQFDL